MTTTVLVIAGALVTPFASLSQVEPQLRVTAVEKNIAYAYAVLPDDYKLSVKRPSPHGSIDRLSEIVRCEGVAMTGGFSRDTPRGLVPQGLILIDGRELSPLNKRGDGGVVILNQEGATILRMRDIAGRPNNWQHAIQSHPILFLNGRLDEPLLDERAANRAAFGRLTDGRHFMMMAYNDDRQGLSALSLRRFAEQANVLLDNKIDWMMNFDGGPSAFLVTANRRVAPTAGQITSYLCAESRK